jgi:hypothetical protein
MIFTSANGIMGTEFEVKSPGPGHYQNKCTTQSYSKGGDTWILVMLWTCNIPIMK